MPIYSLLNLLLSGLDEAIQEGAIDKAFILESLSIHSPAEKEQGETQAPGPGEEAARVAQRQSLTEGNTVHVSVYQRK